jgi:6-phosphofructokinase 1
MKKIKRIGILTGGGDCPGLNAVIRAVAKTAMNDFALEVIGVEDGFEGMVEGRSHKLTNVSVSGILPLGGTILGTSNKGDPWHYPVKAENGSIVVENKVKEVLANFEKMGLDMLVAIGGDGTMTISNKLSALGVPIVGVPKTIDNDLEATDVTFGHDSAVSVAAKAIDDLHTTASSHHRVMILEVMGRYAGWIALNAGIAGGADVILIPEIPFRWEALEKKIIERSRFGKRFSIVCVAEGTKCPEVGEIVRSYDNRRTDAKQLGGVGMFLAEKITERTELETRITVLGHLQRGGSPTAFDRILATRYGVEACRLAAKGDAGKMVALHGNDIVAVTIAEAVSKQKLVKASDSKVLAARSVGTSFGDEL